MIKDITVKRLVQLNILKPLKSKIFSSSNWIFLRCSLILQELEKFCTKNCSPSLNIGECRYNRVVWVFSVQTSSRGIVRVKLFIMEIKILMTIFIYIGNI